MYRSKKDRRERDHLEDNLAALAAQEQDNLSDDDNAAPDMQSEADMEGEKEDPLLLAIDDLEGQVVAALDDVKVHPGPALSTVASAKEAQEQLASLLRPVLEVAAHTAPSVARTYYRGVGPEGIEASCEDVYERVVSDLVLPVLLEMAQSDSVPAKRGASLEFFCSLWRECNKPGSWLDPSIGANAGPYGSGIGSGKHHHHHQQPQQPRAQLKRRQAKRLAREGEILRYWVQASIACTAPGVFSSEQSDVTVESRGVIAASAAIRPSLKHIAQRIRDADDRGANRIFGPVMKMIEGVLKKLFLTTSAETNSDGNDEIRSACIKFLEIVCFCCSAKPQDSSQRRRSHTPDDFSLEDLPAGHPLITRESLESISDYAFSILRGLALLGGQVKIDVNLLSDMMMGGDNTPAAQVVSILKPAALAYLEIESTLAKGDEEDTLDFKIDRPDIEFDFLLYQKSYSLTINAVAALATNRPVFFNEGAVCLARRAADPPAYTDGDTRFTRNSVFAIRSHFRASCLTLLRNALSVQTNSSQILHRALSQKCDMEIQADKALGMAKHTNALKTAGRAARNRANMFYEWDTSAAADQRTSKRQRETDDALAKMRAAKAKRGLGHGIQLPTSMVDSIELVMTNLKHLPNKRPVTPATSSSSKRKVRATLDFVVDAILTNGASLAQEEGRWYTRDGGGAWSMEADGKYELSSKLLAIAKEEDVTPDEEKSSAESAAQRSNQKDGAATSLAGTRMDQLKMFRSQCQRASSEAVSRIVLSGQGSRSTDLAEFANRTAARLAWTLKGISPSQQLKPAQDMALDTILSVKRRLSSQDDKDDLDRLSSEFPLAVSCLALGATSTVNYVVEGQAETKSLSNSVLNEAYAQAFSAFSDNDANKRYKGNEEAAEEEDHSWKYKSSLNMFCGAVLHSSERANDKPVDNERKRVASALASKIQDELNVLPQLSEPSLMLLSAMCDVDDITKKVNDAARKQQQQNASAMTALTAAKQAAEKRATAALLTLRDAAFQRSNPKARRDAVQTAVAVASGRLGASASSEEKALKLVMNVLFARSEALASEVVRAAIAELTLASDYAIQNFTKIQKANSEAKAKENSIRGQEISQKAPFTPESDEEKIAMEKVRKPTILFMALSIRRPEIIKTLFELSAQAKADVLAKAVRQNMCKLARPVGIKHGVAAIALKVAEMATHQESTLLLSLLENLAPATDKNLPSQEFIDACHKIQEDKAQGGRKDARYLTPVVSAMKRDELVSRLPEFVDADDDVFLAALSKMSERLGRQALLFRDEPEPENPTLKGLTQCEQLVFLHKLDFAAAGLPQKRYLGAIRLCLDNDEMFNDRLVMCALDHMSGTFLTGTAKLPLAYMRTIILVCSKHESLHNWICHTLLPRLVEGKIYEDKRQWEGWMRCAHMLESNVDTGVSSAEAISKLPPQQLEMYRDRYHKAQSDLL